MWDVLNKRPRGRLSLRTLHVLATGLIVAVLLCVGAVTKTAYADTKDALLKDGALQYDSKTFAQQPDLGANDPRNFSSGTHVFGYSASGNNKIEYIFIDGGVTIDKATVGAYVTYTYTPPSTYTDQSSPVQVNITHMTSDPTVATSNTCNGFGGLGWIFCPVVNSLSGAIDGIYSFITQFFDTPPLTSDSAIYKIWDAVRSIADIVFVIAFLILIYSQVTSLGISKYGIRSMLPRLIVAAILVNISYWVCSLGIDLSNFLGHSVESFFMSYLSTLQGTTVIPDWSTLTQALIGGGAAGGALIGGIWFSVATAGSAPALVFILLGMAVSVALALLAALIILAARQAILVIFTIVSPLAFAAMVLPSTEKLFDKWKDTMLSMLILFPLFGLVYGGAQVAGAAIVLGSKGNIFLLLLGKFVIFIPLAITPLLVKFSSGILGTVVGAVNDRKKGALDRFRNWNNEQIEFHRKMSLPKNGPIARFNPARRTARFFDNQKRRQTKDLEGAEARSATIAQSTRRYRRAYNYAQASGLEKETSDNSLKAQWDNRRHTDASVVASELRSRKSQLNAKGAADAVETMHSELAAEGRDNRHIRSLLTNDPRLRSQLANDADAIKLTTAQIAREGTRKAMAERKLAEIHAKELSAETPAGEALRAYAAGIMNDVGMRSVMSTAKANASKYTVDDIKNIENGVPYDVASNVDELLQRFKATDVMTERIAYLNLMSHAGAPGVVNMTRAMLDFENTHTPGSEDLDDFKELAKMNGDIMKSGKAIEFWVTNSRDSSGNILSLRDNIESPIAWSGLSAAQFASQNIVHQFSTLRVLATRSPDAYRELIQSLKAAPEIYANIKPLVKNAMERDAGDPDWATRPVDYYN